MSNNLVQFIKTILLVTLLNIVIFAVLGVAKNLPFYYEPYFWVRQIIFMSLISLYFFGPSSIKQTLDEYAEERKLIEDIIEKNYKIFFWEPPVHFLSFIGMYVLLAKADNPDWEIVCTIFIYIWFLSFYLSCYRFYIMHSNPDIRQFLSFSKKDPFTGKRSISIYAKQPLHHAQKNGKFVIGGALFIAEGIPRIMDGDANTRGLIANGLSYWKYNLVAHKNSDMATTTFLLSRYPEDKSLIMGADGVTMDPLKVEQQMRVRNLSSNRNFFSVNVDHEVSPPKWSLKDWFWGKKK